MFLKLTEKLKHSCFLKAVLAIGRSLKIVHTKISGDISNSDCIV